MLDIQIIGNFIFALGIFAYWCIVFFVLYHLIRFGVGGQPKKIAVIFLGGSLLLTMITTLLYAGVDLNSTFDIKNIDLFNL